MLGGILTTLTSMDERYRHEILPLDAADDDPRWRAYVDIFSAVFLDSRASDAGLPIFRTHRRADRARLAMVTTEGPGLEGRAAVAGFNWTRSTINCGSQVPVMIINTIGVLPSHRRRGLLKSMMDTELRAAVADGIPLAVLTASEATIYGRFGFAPAIHALEAELTTSRFALRDDAPRAGGTVEFLTPAAFAPHWQRVTDDFQEAHRGAVRQQHMNYLVESGEWSGSEQGPSRSLRVAAHFDDAGIVDGFALFRHKGWSSEPVTTEVVQLTAPSPAVELALWQALADLDLVERLTARLQPGDVLPQALRDTRALKITDHSDGVWLRVLDLPAATAGRRFDADGEVRVRIDDPLGHCAGTWDLRAVDGVGTATAGTAPAEVRLGAEALAQLWLGGTTAWELAAAGRITGEPEAVARLGRLLRWDTAARNRAQF